MKITAPSSILQISQVAVYDTLGINRALTGTASVSVTPNFKINTCVISAAAAIDGKLTNKNFGGCSNTTYNGMFHSVYSAGDWWQVDLGASYSIASIVYYNRGDCCTERAIGNIIQGLDSQKNVVCSATMTTKDLVQMFQSTTNTITSIYSILFIFLIYIYIYMYDPSYCYVTLFH